MQERRLIRIAHSPDADDAFMFYGLTHGLIDSGPFEIEHVLADIESLNQAAFEGRYEVTAVSVHALAHLTDRYGLSVVGGSFGDGYGPRLVARGEMGREELAGKPIAIPGRFTTAALALRLWLDDTPAELVEVPFDQIMERVKGGEVAGGVIIHEGQLTYRDEGLRLVVDLGEWFGEISGGLPLPLGVNAVRLDLGEEAARRLVGLMRESIAYALSHRQEALSYALRFGRGIDRKRADRFVGMYVNELTLNMGERGRRAIELLLSMARERELVPEPKRLSVFEPLL